MKDFVRTLLLISGLAWLTACGGGGGSEPDKPTPVTPTPTPPQTEKKEIKINVTIPSTRMNGTGFETGDKVGLYVVSFNSGSSPQFVTTGNHVDNMPFTFSGSWEPASKVYWPDDCDMAHLYVYYPYSTVSSIKAIPFNVEADQGTEQRYRASDFLAGSSYNVRPTTSAVSIAANHVMSRLSIELTAGEGLTPEELASAKVSVRINGVQTKSTFDLETLTVTPAGESTSVTPWKDGNIYRAMIVPQEVREAALVTVVVDGIEFNLESAYRFESGKQHTITIPIEKSSGGFSVGISSWGDGGEFGGTAE